MQQLLVLAAMAFVLAGSALLLGRHEIALDPRGTSTVTPHPTSGQSSSGVNYNADGPGSKPAATATQTGGQAHLQASRLPAASPQYLVLIVLDGARPDYFSVPNIPHVKALIQNGTTYTNAWAGILESETPSGHAAISTGSQPREDGILSFDWANSDNIPINLFSEQAVRSGTMENYLKAAPASSIAALVHRQNPAARVVALSGYKYYAADALGGPDADAIMYYTGLPGGKFGPTAVPGHMPPASVLNAPGLILPSRSYGLGEGNHMAMELARVSFQKMRQKATLINLPETDWPLGHVDGASRDQKDLRTLMQGFDRDLAMLENTYRQAGVLDKTLFVVTSDHGFSLIDHKVPHDVVNQAVAQAGTTIVRDTYHTASYVWIRDKSKAAAVAQILAQKQNPYFQSVYFKSVGPQGSTYTRASGPDLFHAPGVEDANQYLLNTFNGPNSPDVVVFMRERSMFTAGAEVSWKGDHGGADWEAQHLPLILSGPGVRKGYVSNYPAPLMDIAPTSLALMHVPVRGMQGVPLADAMQVSSASQQAAQQTQGGVLAPVVAALQAESQAEIQAGQ